MSCKKQFGGDMIARVSRFQFAVLTLALPVAYAAGWLADAMLNDDPCLDVSYDEGDSIDFTNELWPARTNCRVPLSSGGTVLKKGDATVFWSVFVFWLVTAALLVLPIRWWVRISVAALAWALSVAVIFV